MADKNTTNFDDYYAQIAPVSGDSKSDADGKKPGLKLKVKAKKVEDAPKPEAPIAAPTVEESVESKPKKTSAAKGPAIIWSDPSERVARAEVTTSEVETESVKVRENILDRKPIETRPGPAPTQQSAHTPEKRSVLDTRPRPSDNRNSGGNSGFGRDKKKGESSVFADRGYASGRKSIKTRGYNDEGEDGGFRRSHKAAGGNKKERNIEEIKQTLTDKTGQEIAIPELINVKEFSEKIGIPLPKIITELMKNGMLVTINTKIDYDTCYLIGETFDVRITREANTDVSVASLMEGNVSELLKDDDTSKSEPRAPIVSVMGHVDHGKTSILDAVRSTEIAKDEAGGITQKIGAYQVEKNGKKITFLDTPGHEAFSIMRSRGAKLTDLAVIVIAADEGMKPQTIESINHARDAGVPMIIAVNKMDKPGANLDLVRGQLAEQGLQPEDWGGDVVVVPVSAHTGLGIDTLIDMILLSTEMMELKAVVDRPGIGTVIESHLDARLGSLTTVLLNAGTIKKGDYVVCASAHGRVRFLRDFRGKNLDEAGPSVPVLISGLSATAEGGSILQVMPDAVTAATKAHEFELMKNKKSIHNFEGASLDLLLNRLKAGGLKQLKVVLKCDSNGSLEALKNALSKLSTSETQVTFIHSGVGDVNDSDVLMAGTGQALLIAYNVSVGTRARNTLANSKIEFIDKKVIYHVLERVESIITGMVDTRYEDIELGEARVKAIFYTSKEKMIVGLEILSGKIENRAKIRLIREGSKAGAGEVANLKSGLLDVNEIEAGNDCGISYKGDHQPQVGDVLELYKTVIKK